MLVGLVAAVAFAASREGSGGQGNTGRVGDGDCGGSPARCASTPPRPSAAPPGPPVPRRRAVRVAHRYGLGTSCPPDCPAVTKAELGAAVKAIREGRSRAEVVSRARARAAAASILNPTPEPSVDPTCPITGSEVVEAPAMRDLGCRLVASDTARQPDPLPFWGQIDCAEASRYAYFPTGGDGQHPTADGEPPSQGYRALTVEDGDNVYGERCELGENNAAGPTAFYHEGRQVLTYFSERLPPNFPLSTSDWQTVMQMKQAQPSHDDGGGVALEMEAREGRWMVVDQWNEVWSFPARTGVWTRFAWDVYYSKDPAKGWLQVSADLNGDGDFEDPGERSPVLRGATLATEVGGYEAEDGLPAGAAIPSHLRIGIYHDPAISCAAPVECTVDVANVQILAPPS